MIITHKIEMDVARNVIIPPVNVVQDDKYSRNLEIALTNGDVVWEPPGDAKVLVRFRKSDGTGGNYDTLPDDTIAGSIAGNVVTVALAPQVCTAAGKVELVVGLVSGGKQLHTFVVKLLVQRNPGLAVVSENYYKIAGSVADSGWSPNMYLGTNSAGQVIAVDDPNATAVLLGQTPQTLSASKSIKLSCEEECAYTVKSNTVADFDIASGTAVGATLAEVDGHHQITANSGVANWYQSYVEMTVGGLTVGEIYNFIFDAAGMVWDQANHITIGHFILHDADGNKLVTRPDAAAAALNAYEFTATTESVRLVWYPATNSTFSAGASVANVNAIYINRAGTKTHTEILELSGSFTGAALLGVLPAGVTIEAEPACMVYVRGSANASGAQSRHAGKICVCFGDSVTGNMDAPYDYPSVLAEETGMEVVNAGFGGCRMSDTHPTECYAAFSMVKLAEAVASGDWTEQDAQVGSMSDTTNAAEHLAALKAVNWSEVDFVTIAYGTNDIQGGVALDNEDGPQDVTTYLGALRYALEKLLTAYPHLKVLLLTPIYRYWNDEDLDSDEKLFDGQPFTAWGDGLLDVAQEYKIPGADLYRTLGFNAITRKYFFPATDGTHPNSFGQKRIGEKIAAKLLAEY